MQAQPNTTHYARTGYRNCPAGMYAIFKGFGELVEAPAFMSKAQAEARADTLAQQANLPASSIEGDGFQDANADVRDLLAIMCADYQAVRSLLFLTDGDCPLIQRARAALALVSL